MKETVQKYIHTMKDFWQGRTRKQKISFGASIFFVLTVAILTAFLTSRTSLVPLYSNLSPAETGSIKESLDARGIKS